MIRLEEFKYLGTTKRKYIAGSISICDVEYHEPVSEDWHYHDNAHLSLFLQGGNNEIRKRDNLVLSAGVVGQYNKGEKHRSVEAVLPTKILNVEFTDDFFSTYDLSFDHFDGQLASNIDTKFTLLKAYQESMLNDPYSEDSIHLMLLSLFNKDVATSTPNWLSKMKVILNDRWNEFIPLAELSKAVDVHPVTISRFFPKHFRCTLGEYMRKIKIEKALEALKTPNSSLTEIALDCGFSDQSHFIRTFKKVTGFKPGTLRRL